MLHEAVESAEALSHSCSSGTSRHGVPRFDCHYPPSANFVLGALQARAICPVAGDAPSSVLVTLVPPGRSRPTRRISAALQRAGRFLKGT